MDWYDRMGWDLVLDSERGLWMAGGRSRLLGAAVIVGLERVKPAVVVSQRAFLPFDYSLDDRPPVVALRCLASVVFVGSRSSVGDAHEKETKVRERGGSVERVCGVRCGRYDTEDGMSKTGTRKGPRQMREAQVHWLALSPNRQGQMDDGALLPARRRAPA